MNEWEWPQYTLATMIILNILLTAYFYGEPRTGNYHVFPAMVSAFFWIWILSAGGFFR